MMYVWIAIGSALGGVARYWSTGLVAQTIGSTFPWGTMIVNVIGSFVIGWFAVMIGPDGRFMVSAEMRQFVMVGICGGYTTFSSFSMQTFSLLQDGEFIQAGFNIILSVVLCLVFVWLGYIFATYLNQLKGAGLS
jgi:fluoride exporter